ncbi:MAG: hypothetical protein Q4B54_02010 [Coriobacteriales bacterium]|nr:hypothetical protein [Coriobacteriales bacterium]
MPAPVDDKAAPQPATTGDGAPDRAHMTPPVAPQLKRDPQLRDATGAVGHPAVSKRKRMGEFLTKHQRALGVGIALFVVAIMGAVWFVTTLTNAPSHAQIADDVAARIPNFSYAGGTFGPDLEIPLSRTSVTSCTATQTPEGMEVSDGVGSAAYDVAAEVTYDDGRIRVVRNVSATYVRANEGWTLGGELTEQGTSFTPLSGVDESKVLTTMEPILNAAGSAGNEALSHIYAGGEFNVVGHDFQEGNDQNAAIDNVVVHCVSNADFYSYEGNVTARFAFESGEWHLQSAEADEGAGTRSYAPLLGTWSGTMVSHTADAGSCFGARDQAFVLTINSLGETINNQATVEGTVSAVAHFHGMLISDKKTSAGDEYLKDAAFTGAIIVEQRLEGSTLSLEGTVSTGSPAGSSAGSSRNSTTTNASASRVGEVSFEVDFGTDDDPSAAVARVTTSYESEELVLMLIPRKTTTRFVDTYLLTRTDQ